jgi:hypothetical protein
VKYALGDVPIAKELEGKILTLAKSIEDLYNEDEQEVE